jgi:hypothetical protein
VSRARVRSRAGRNPVDDGPSLVERPGSGPAAYEGEL